jgi:PPK2 family polyphosphate:nucleotide phosphotransferase
MIVFANLNGSSTMPHDLIVKPQQKVDLKHWDASSTKGIPDRDEADKRTEAAVLQIGELQNVLFGEQVHSLLVVLQGMDASGKDGTIRKIFDNVNPTGVQVTSFKTPTDLERRHDFLWRCHEKVPPRGDIGVFNRSYYEEVLIVRVHADKFLPPDLRQRADLWDTRFEIINAFERLLYLNDTTILKIFLHISKDEQRRRFIARQQDPQRNWKLSAADFDERPYWNDYQKAYEEMLAATSTKLAPWYIIPSDRKWVRNYLISKLVVKTLEDMKPEWPKLTDKALLTRKFK